MKRIALALILVLILVFSTVTAVVAFLVSQRTSLWESNLEDFIVDATFNNGKIFAVDVSGFVRCFDAVNGESVWNSSSGAHLIQSTITTYQGKVYVGTMGSVVKSLDENSGEVQLEFQAPLTDIGWKSAPSFTVANGLVLASSGGGTDAYDAVTGEVLWNNTLGWPLYWVSSYPQLFLPFEDGFFCVPTLSFLDPSNGSIVWDLPGYSNPPVFYQDQAILWNYDLAGNPDAGTNLLCVNAAGSTVWSFDVGCPMYQPAVYQDLVLFGAYDGYFYAVNLPSGNLKWKTRVTDQNGQAYVNSTLPHYPLAPVASPVQVNPQEGRLLWSFAFIQNGWGGRDEYAGMACSLDIADGNCVWIRPIEKNMSISSDNAGVRFTSLGLVLLNNRAFLTAGSDLWILDEATGSVTETLHFEHYVLAPIVGNNRLFVAADLWLFAYS